MATPREIITAAYAKSTKNQPEEIATNETELLEVVNRKVRSLFSPAATVNPLAFGKTDTMTWGGTAYPRPTDAESVFRIENAGAKVHIVPFDDRGLMGTQDAVYVLGTNYYVASGLAGNPALTAWYSKTPTDAADIDATIDASWPETFNNLIVLDVALYLAEKDGRDEELPGLRQDRTEWLNLFTAYLNHETVGETRRYGTGVWSTETSKVL